MLIVVTVSFAGRTAYGQILFQWTCENYARFFDALYVSIFVQTLFVAVVTTVCTIFMGYPLAYYIAKLPERIRQKGIDNALCAENDNPCIRTDNEIDPKRNHA